MKTLNKESYLYIKTLISENELRSILSFCEGLGIDTNNYSSPVHYKDGKLRIRYRAKYEYFIIF